MKDRNIYIVMTALLLVAVGLIISTYSSEYDFEAFGGDVGAVLVPRVYLILWLLLSTLSILSVVKSKAGSLESADTMSVSRLSSVIIISIATASGMISVGFVIAMIPGFFLFCLAFGYRKPFTLILISILGSSLTWIIFDNLLELPLPHSPWFTLI